MPSSRTSKNQPAKSESATVSVLDNRGNVLPPSMQMVAIVKISLPSSQPRRDFNVEKMEQLIESVRIHGILENLIVRPIPNCEEQYELVAGERRYRAAIAAGLTEVPVTIRSLTDEQALALALVENLTREDLNCIDETEGILQLLALKLKLKTEEVIALLYRMMDESKGKVKGKAQKVPQNVLGNEHKTVVETVFASLGKLTWESFVSSRLPLLKLPSEILANVRDRKITYTKAVAIARVKDSRERTALLEDTLALDLSLTQIKQRIQAKNKDGSSQPPRAMITDVTRRIQASKIWEHPHKWEKVQALLSQLSALVG